MNKKIEIIVAKTGETTIESKGFEGASCQSATQFIRQSLGHSTRQHLKPEFYQMNSAKQQTHQ